MQNRLWRVDSPPISLINSSRVKKVDFFEDNGIRIVIVVDGSFTGYLLSLDDGGILGNIPFAYHATREDQLKTQKSWGVEDNVFAGDFWPGAFSLDPERKLMACGALMSKRLRIISVSSPYATIREAHTAVNPFLPNGGVWSVSNVLFAGGKYLIAEYIFAGRGSRFSYDQTDIFDINTWDKVWSKNSHDVQSVRLSPDGKQLAFIRRESDNVYLEIWPSIEYRGASDGLPAK